MLAQILIASGAALLGLLGTIHIIATFFTNKLDPREPATIAAMKATGLVLGGRTSLWNAWVGLNAVLGPFLLLFAATYLLLAVCHMSLLRDSPPLAWLPVAGGAAYLAIALRFGGPIIGFAVATACFLVAAMALGSGTISQNPHKSTGHEVAQTLSQEQENGKTILAIFRAIEERDAAQFRSLLQPD